MTDDEIVALAHKYIKPNRYPRKEELIAFAHAARLEISNKAIQRLKGFGYTFEQGEWKAAAPEAKPVAWMQSAALNKLMMRHCGSQSMLARVSDHKLQPDYVPLYSTPPAAGMVSVPVEPTEEMIDAAFSATVWPDLNRATTQDVIKALRRNMVKEYKAMLLAAKGGGL